MPCGISVENDKNNEELETLVDALVCVSPNAEVESSFGGDDTVDMMSAFASKSVRGRPESNIKAGYDGGASCSRRQSIGRATCDATVAAIDAWWFRAVAFRHPGVGP